MPRYVRVFRWGEQGERLKGGPLDTVFLPGTTMIAWKTDILADPLDPHSRGFAARAVAGRLLSGPWSQHVLTWAACAVVSCPTDPGPTRKFMAAVAFGKLGKLELEHFEFATLESSLRSLDGYVLKQLRPAQVSGADSSDITRAK